MIVIDLLNNNNIVTLSSEGKLPIKSSSGYMFYNSNELLCVAVGACVGKHTVIYCAQNKIDLSEFEYFKVDMESNIIKVYIGYPKNFDYSGLKKVLENCEISKKISIPIEIIMNESKKTIEENKKSNLKKPCCGG